MSRKISRHELCEGVVGCEQSVRAEGFVQHGERSVTCFLVLHGSCLADWL